MVNYRRNWITGGTFFFTVTLKNRNSRVLTDHVDALRAAFRFVTQRNPFQTIAIVVLPEHIHTVWKLPANDDDYAGRWKAIKPQFTQHIGLQGFPLHRNARGEYELWQSRYWEHTIRNDEDLIRHVDYIHYNPVKHGLVERVADWPYSSFHQFVRRGLLELNWGYSENRDDSGQFGE